jgi:competence protein ComEC
LIVASAMLGCVSGIRIERPLNFDDGVASAIVHVAVVLEEPIAEGRSRGWARIPGHPPVRARITGLEGETGSAGTRIVGRARLRDLGRRATPDRRDTGRSSAARGDRLRIAFREAVILWREPEGARARWANHLDERLGRSSGLWRALSLADAGALDPAARERVQEVGMAHLLALSGMHTAIVAGALLWPWRRKGRRALLYVLPVLVAWVILAGAGPSLVRAVGMAAWWVVARARGRRCDASDGLAAVALCELALRPQLLCGVGWWLSYSATLAVIRTASAVRLWPRPLAAVAVSGAAQLATLPWVLDAFGFVNLAAPVTLLLVGPIFAIVLMAGLAGMAIGGLVPGLSPWADPLTIASGHLFGFALRLVAPADRWALHAPGFDGLAWSAILLAVVACLWPAGWHVRTRVVAAVPLVLVAILAQHPRHEWVLFDVGQGDAAVLRCGADVLVIDTGPHFGAVAPAEWTVVDWLRRRGLDRVDVLVTHGHLDHSGGLGSLLATDLVDEVIVARADAGRPWSDRLEHASRRAGASVRRVAEGDVLEVGHCRLEVMWPPSGAVDLHTNDRSIVLSWEVGATRAMSAGDLERVGERGLGSPGRHDWLKVAHHGGDTGTDTSFLESVRPAHAFVCCGVGNRYGHPDPAVLARLEAVGARVHRTDRCGFLRIRWGDPSGPPELDCGRTACP